MKKIFILLFISKVLSYLVFPLSKTSTDITSKDNHKEIMEKLYKCIYSATVTVGSKKINVKATISQGQTEFVIGGQNTINNKYNELDSESYNRTNEQKLSLGFGSYSEGYSSTENFFIKNDKNEIETVQNVSFILGTESKYSSSEAELGIHLPFPGSKEEYNFIVSLKRANRTKSYNWYLDFDNFVKGEGKIVIDGYPDNLNSKKYNHDKYTTIPTLNKGYTYFWGLKFSDIYYEESAILGQNVETQFDFNLGTISAPIDFLYSIEKLFFSKYIEENICFKEQYGTYFKENFFYCKNTKEFKAEEFKSIYLKSKDMEIILELDYKDLFHVINDNIYFMMTFREKSEILRLGEVFLKKYYIVFNQDLKTIGYYQGMENSKKSEQTNKNKKVNIIIILIVVIVILIGIIAAGIIFYIKKGKPRKNRANELDDENYDYVSKKEDSDNKKNNLIDENNININ